LRRIELRLGRYRPFDAHEHITHGILERLAARRQFQAPADLHQQVVVEIPPQPQERVAHRRLRQVHAFGGAAHGAQMQEMVQGDE
jgi:hypothetical protein